MKKISADLSEGIWQLPSFPIVLVTVADNIMTAGAFHFYSFEPASLMVGIIRKQYTYELINQYMEFGVNIPSTEQIELVQLCGRVSGRNGEDKYELAGVNRQAGSVIKSCLIAECPLNIECKLVYKIEYPGSHQWFVGEIKAVHVEENYQRDHALMWWSREYRRVGERLKT